MTIRLETLDRIAQYLATTPRGWQTYTQCPLSWIEEFLLAVDEGMPIAEAFDYYILPDCETHEGAQR